MAKLTRAERRKLRRQKGTSAERMREDAAKKKELTGEVGAIISEGEKLTCLICKKPIKKGEAYRRLPPDAKVPEWRFYHYPDCGPGTEAWFKFHPSRVAELIQKGREVIAQKRLSRRMRRKGITRPLTKGEITMAKKATKTKRGEHLKPMEPVVVPDAVIKKQPKEVQKLLKELNDLDDRSSKDGSKIRKGLRKLGFKLSDFRGEGNGKEKTKAPEKKVEKKSKKKAAPEEEDA